jgi:hypothetical protein
MAAAKPPREVERHGREGIDEWVARSQAEPGVRRERSAFRQGS